MLSPFGLCDACAHQRRVGNTRGSTFSLCGLARSDRRFPKYPRMPVLRCDGFEHRGDAEGPAGTGSDRERPRSAADGIAAGPAGSRGDDDVRR